MLMRLAAAVVALGVLFAAGNHINAAGKSKVLTIFPLGDSITFGWSRVAKHHQIPGGYRAPLYTMLTKDSYVVHYVGSNTRNPTAMLMRAHATQHDGWPGWRIDQIAAHVKHWLATSGYRFKGPAYPNFILLHISTNDIIQHFDPKYPHKNESESQFMHDMESRMSALVQEIVQLRPRAHLLVAQVIPLGGWSPKLKSALWNQEVREFNTFVKNKLVPACRAKGQHVSAVNEYANFSTPDGTPIWKHLPDKCHPDPYGYRLMASTWYRAILKIEKK
jgi:lysophospholipase L1-like esterase